MCMAQNIKPTNDPAIEKNRSDAVQRWKAGDTKNNIGGLLFSKNPYYQNSPTSSGAPNPTGIDPAKINQRMKTGLAVTMSRKTGTSLSGSPGFLTSGTLSAKKNVLGG